jgi:predicted dehydrogenase
VRGVKRRDFLKGMAVIPISTGSMAGSQEGEVGIGVIGTGVHGKRLLSQLQKVKGAKVVAICDIYEPNLLSALEITGGNVRTYSDYRKMLEEEKGVQAVIIATPHNLHAGMSIDSMRSGKHVFCEPPMGMDIEECDRVIEAQKETGRVYQIGFQRRYSALYRHAFDFIRSGMIGRVGLVHLQWHKRQSWRRAVADQRWEKVLNWRLYKDSSLGLVGEYGLHLIDLLRWFTGKTPEKIFALGGIDEWRDGREIYDNVELLLGCPGGLRAFVSLNITNSYRGDFELFMGTKGSILIAKEQKGWMFKEADAPKSGWETLAKREAVGDETAIILDAMATKLVEEEEMIRDELANSFQAELQDFIECIREGRRPEAGLQEGYEATKAALRIIESIS